MNTGITLWGVHILPIYVQIAQLIATTFLGAGLVGFIYQRYNEFRGRALDRFSISRSSVRTLDDGRKMLVIRNIGRVERLELAVRGRKLRARMVKGAKQSTPDQAFVMLERNDHQDEMIEAVRDAISWVGENGEIVDMCGVPTTEQTIVFAVTASDVSVESVRSFKVHFVEESALSHFVGDDTVWCFENGRRHDGRVATLRTMAMAHRAGDGRIIIDGMATRITGIYKLKVRV